MCLEKNEGLKRFSVGAGVPDGARVCVLDDKIANLKGCDTYFRMIPWFNVSWEASHCQILLLHGRFLLEIFHAAGEHHMAFVYDHHVVGHSHGEADVLF